MRLLWMIAPAGLEDWFRAIGRPRRPGDAMPPPFRATGGCGGDSGAAAVRAGAGGVGTVRSRHCRFGWLECDRWRGSAGCQRKQMVLGTVRTSLRTTVKSQLSTTANGGVL
jgi:hypothetical protein